MAPSGITVVVERAGGAVPAAALTALAASACVSLAVGVALVVRRRRRAAASASRLPRGGRQAVAGASKPPRDTLPGVVVMGLPAIQAEATAAKQ
eukprot:254828-Prymnesium_polylepis.1